MDRRGAEAEGVDTVSRGARRRVAAVSREAQRAHVLGNVSVYSLLGHPSEDAEVIAGGVDVVGSEGQPLLAATYM